MTLRVTASVRFARGGRGRKVLELGAPERPETPRGRIPRVTRLLALAHRFEQLVRDGVVKDYADLARLGGVSRARVTQIMNLLNLAPEIQEHLLMLPAVTDGRDPVTERQLRRVLAVPDWRRQRRMWVRGAGADGWSFRRPGS